MQAALRECEIVGVATNVAFLERVIAHDAFASGRIDTGLIDRHRDALFPVPASAPEAVLVAAALAEYCGFGETVADRARGSGEPQSPWNALDAWWPNSTNHAIDLAFADGDVRHHVALRPQTDGTIPIDLPSRSLRRR
jgi:3-methylcrotonyl-CoA carboxylase alpha subunit